MVDQLKASTNGYLGEWAWWCQANGLKALERARATAIGWKVASLGIFAICAGDLLGGVRQAHIGRVDDRLIGSFLLNEPIAGIPIIKLMGRRPGSHDPTGLDHVDFLVSNPAEYEPTLQAAGVPHEWQSNEAHRRLSLPFGGALREAKLVDHIVLDVCVQELAVATAELKEQL